MFGNSYNVKYICHIEKQILHIIKYICQLWILRNLWIANAIV
jgi:hypothetical protein